MKYLALTFLLCFFCRISFSQTYITPSIGYDFMNMESVFIVPNFHGFEVLNSPYSINSLQYGLEMEQTIYDKLNTSAHLCFAQKSVHASVFNIIPFDGFIFNQLRVNLLINYKLTNYFFLGIGYDYNQMKELKYTLRGESFSPAFKPLLIDHGSSLSARGNWKNIELKLYFHKGMNNNVSNSPHELSVKPIKYFGFSLGYRIKIINSFKRDKKTKCPTV